MNDQYMRELRRHLHCSRKVRNRLIEHFSAYQGGTVDGTPDYGQMVTMFGPPKEMAQTLMEEVTGEERNAYSRNILFGKIVAIAMVLCFVIFSLYIMFIKEINVIEYREYTNVYQAYEIPEEMESVP